MTRFSSDFRIMPKKQRYRLKCPVKNETCPPTKLSFSKENSCGRCRKSENEAELKCCSRCKIAYYCSKKCQGDDSKIHSYYCKMSTITPYGGGAWELEIGRLSFKWSIAISMKSEKSLENLIRDYDDFASLICKKGDPGALIMVLSMRSMAYLYMDLSIAAISDIEIMSLWDPSVFWKIYLKQLETNFSENCLIEFKETVERSKEKMIENERKWPDSNFFKDQRCRVSAYLEFFDSSLFSVLEKDYEKDLITELKSTTTPILIAVLAIKFWVVDFYKLHEYEEMKRELDQILNTLKSVAPCILDILVGNTPPSNPYENDINKNWVFQWMGNFSWHLFHKIGNAREYIKCFLNSQN